jgi:hypothetical protein
LLKIGIVVHGSVDFFSAKVSRRLALILSLFLAYLSRRLQRPCGAIILSGSGRRPEYLWVLGI